MRHRIVPLIAGGVALLGVTWLVPPAAAGQAQSRASKTTAGATKGKVPRTPDGRPDLQGIWDYRTITPLERPSALAGKEVLTNEEAANFERAENRRLNRDTPEARAEQASRAGTDVRSYNEFWYDRGSRIVGDRRTSLIVDPPDGKVPALTPEARKRLAAEAEARNRPARGPEDRGLPERCLIGLTGHPPMLSNAYNNNVQLLQTPEYVVIFTEMIHNARIVPLDGRPHGTVRQWNGDSRGHWEGDTLVVDTTHFLRALTLPGSSANTHVIERFTRVDADTLLYRFTVEDPTTWTRPWTAEVPMTRTEVPMYEYACHEGNHGLVGILAGARAAEKAAGGQLK